MDICELAITQSGVLKRHPWEEARIQVVAHKLRKAIMEIGKKECTVLDMGCGDAYVAYRLSCIFPQLRIYCVDTAFTRDIQERLRKQFPSERLSLHDSLEDVQKIFIGTADFVFLLDVIEHIENDVDFLKGLRASPLISERTQVFITVPAFQGLFSNHDVFLKHYHRHTLATLNNRIQSAGFRKINDGYFFFLLLLPRMIQKILEKKTSEVKGIGAYKGSILKTTLIKNILLLDYYFFDIFTSLGIKLPGLSCFTICKKE